MYQCNSDNHVVDICFKVRGYPDWQPKDKKGSLMSHNLNTDIQDSKNHLVAAETFVAKSGVQKPTVTTANGTPSQVEALATTEGSNPTPRIDYQDGMGEEIPQDGTIPANPNLHPLTASSFEETLEKVLKPMSCCLLSIWVANSTLDNLKMGPKAADVMLKLICSVTVPPLVGGFIFRE
ncbi:hypothetical protein Nepgr_007298 [Nepenthes gracilis]|uniref:Uncharacterized protein n=1 Tax=Nepenthes gracilis TaxID=150966 RepID=A0AAD3XI61_NEPGR|nr:hypothetical protein Nepgr_007298 [Nepenthes gracilis]